MVNVRKFFSFFNLFAGTCCLLLQGRLFSPAFLFTRQHDQLTFVPRSSVLCLVCYVYAAVEVRGFCSQDCLCFSTIFVYLGNMIS
jgi:hypothetical protein